MNIRGEMLEAACKAKVNSAQTNREWMSIGLDAALAVLDSKIAAMLVDEEQGDVRATAGWNAAICAVRALGTKPEVPEEVKDLIEKHFGANPADWVKQLAKEAYRRGQQSVQKMD